MLTWRLTAVVALLAATVGARGGLATAPFERPLAGDKQALHVLNRLAYGPSAADLEQVRRLGIRKWTQLQLRPERIAESPVLEAKLALLETLRAANLAAIREIRDPAGWHDDVGRRAIPQTAPPKGPTRHAHEGHD